ncbi:Hypothetical protein A7982_06459 [Minicystis rosea]|nr:Hypothetical protein A7982_06459 [Minicystis rosea]
MAFWDRFKPKTPGAPALVVQGMPQQGGALKNGKKHGRWIEREEREDTRWNEQTCTFDKLGTYGWRELDYVDGKKQGPFVWRHSNGMAQRIGTYVDDQIHGPLVIRYRSGTIAGEGTFRTGKLHGHWVQRHENGNLYYETDYVDDKRMGPWVWAEENGQVTERGAHDNGERTGEWSLWSKDGVLIEQGTYVTGKRHGAWKLRRADGSICAEGEYVAGVMHGPWRTVSKTGVLGPPRTCADEADLQRWGELEACVELIAAYDGGDAWVERAKSSFADLAQPWQVKRGESFGQATLSAPIGAAWQLRAAMAVPMHVVCRDEVWSIIASLLDKLPGEAVALVEATGQRYPSYAPRDWLTAILENEQDDPRTRLVSRFEPGREFTTEQMRRFARRVPHLQALSLRECAFPDGFAPLFEHGFPELERLLVVRSEMTEDGYRELLGVLARATWVGKLEQLAIVGNGGGPSDTQLAALLANPHFTALTYFTIDDATVGPATARALRDGVAARSLVEVTLRDSRLDVAALTALATCPALEELELRDCELPDMTTRQAMAITSPKLRRVKLAGTLGVEEYAYGDQRSGYAVARRLAVMPALSKLELLDLSDNHLDGLAARVLARSPYIRGIRKLDWTANEGADELAELGSSLVANKPGNVVVLKL